jgi:UDP-N-acetylglucosamine 2-epimerase (non-hydrolysing)
MNVLLVAGARPNFMKIAPLIRCLKARRLGARLVHTGQHYDEQMSGSFLSDLEIGAPDFFLGIGSGTHAQQTARVMEAFEPVLLEIKPDWVVVVGDVNSTLAAALVVSKLKHATGSRIAHVEAGLRSGDWTMPEEINRVLTDRLSDLLLTPSPDALPNLLAEGIPKEKVRFVGNVMVDTLLHQLPRARRAGVLDRLGLTRGKYVLATLHRPSNVDTATALEPILAGLNVIGEKIPLVVPLHPRTSRNIEKFGLRDLIRNAMVLGPLGYTEMLAVTDGAMAVLTDSGGLQEETTALGVPCITLRQQTERPITIAEGTNRLAPWPLTPTGIHDSFLASIQTELLEKKPLPQGWDGRAGERIVDALLEASSGSSEPSAEVRPYR